MSSASSRRCSWGLSTNVSERQNMIMSTGEKSAGRWVDLFSVSVLQIYCFRVSSESIDVIVLAYHWSVRSITTGEQLITVKWSVLTTVLPRTLDLVSVCPCEGCATGWTLWVEWRQTNLGSESAWPASEKVSQEPTTRSFSCGWIFTQKLWYRSHTASRRGGHPGESVGEG